MFFRLAAVLLFVTALTFDVAGAHSSKKTRENEIDNVFVLEAFLLSDRDNDNRADPGDIVQYTLSGKGSFLFEVEPETSSLHFLSGSVEVRRGVAVVIEGNSKSDSKVRVRSSSPQGKQTIISFNAAVKSNQPADAIMVSLQGRVTAQDGKQHYTTVSPAGLNEETSLPLDSYVDLSTELSAVIVDGLGNGKASLGAVIEYKILVRNEGNQKAKDVWIYDEASPKTELLKDSVKSEGSIYTRDNTLNISLGEIEANEVKEISFRVRVARFGSIMNQAHACHLTSRKERNCVLSYDPQSQLRRSPTVTRYENDGPVVYATKSVALGTVPTGVKPGKALPGDFLTYTVQIANLDSSSLYNVQFSDSIPDSTTLVYGSVTTTCGRVVYGNQLEDPSVLVECPVIQPGNEIVVTFCVQIAQTLSNDCVSSQGEVEWEGSGAASVVTDDPATLPLNDPTVVCVNAGPVVSASNTWSLSNGKSVASPGDVVSYTIEISNTGASAGADVSFYEVPDVRSTLVVGSVRTTCGSVAGGNSLAAGGVAKAVSVVIPLLLTQQTCVIKYDVSIKDPFPDNNLVLSVQGTVSGSNFETLVTDDPSTPVWDDATNTPVDASPVISVKKGYSLLVDYDFDGHVDPGDTILYTITVKNSGNAPAANLLIRDIPDPRTSLSLGSVVTSQGTVTSGDSEFDSSVEVDVGSLQGYSSATASFAVVVGNPFPVGERRVVNQAVLTYNVQGHTYVVVSGDPTTPVLDDPTYTTVDCEPSIHAAIEASLGEDVDGDEHTGPGDTLHYMITVTNDGNQAASGVRLTDKLDPNTELILGSVRTSRTNSGVLSGNSAADPTNVVEVNIGELRGAGDVFIITFDAKISESIPAGVNTIDNQAYIVGDNFEGAVSSDVLSTLVVGGSPSVSLTLVADASSAMPGSHLHYTAVISNTGNRDAADVLFSIPSFDVNAPFVLGSATTSQGRIVSGNSVSDTTLVVAVGNVAAKERDVTITFSVAVVNPTPNDATSLTLQAIVTGSNFEEVISTDPNTGLSDAPTNTEIDGTPAIVFQKTVRLTQDLNKNGKVDAGDGVTYYLSIVNEGSQDAGEVVVVDNLPSGLLFLAGSVKTTQGSIVNGNNAGDGGFDRHIMVDLGTVSGNTLSKVQVSFQAIVETPWTLCSNVVSNQASLSGSNVAELVSDDPTTGLIDDPTNITLNAFPIINVIRSTDPSNFNPTVPLVERITITNAGEQDACGVLGVIGTLGPVDVTSISVTSGVAQYNQQTNQITWDVGSAEAEGGMANISFSWTLNDPCAVGDSTTVSGSNFNTVLVPSRTVGEPCLNRARNGNDVSSSVDIEGSADEEKERKQNIISRIFGTIMSVIHRFI